MFTSSSVCLDFIHICRGNKERMDDDLKPLSTYTTCLDSQATVRRQQDWKCVTG